MCWSAYKFTNVLATTEVHWLGSKIYLIASSWNHKIWEIIWTIGKQNLTSLIIASKGHTLLADSLRYNIIHIWIVEYPRQNVLQSSSTFHLDFCCSQLIGYKPLCFLFCVFNQPDAIRRKLFLKSSIIIILMFVYIYTFKFMLCKLGNKYWNRQ